MLSDPRKWKDRVRECRRVHVAIVVLRWLTWKGHAFRTPQAFSDALDGERSRIHARPTLLRPQRA